MNRSTPHTERFGPHWTYPANEYDKDWSGASISDLHFQLGKLLEERPGVIGRNDGGGGAWDTNRRCFEEVPLVGGVDLETVRRLEGHAAQCRAEVGEERWAQLQAEWSDPLLVDRKLFEGDGL